MIRHGNGCPNPGGRSLVVPIFGILAYLIAWFIMPARPIAQIAPAASAV